MTREFLLSPHAGDYFITAGLAMFFSGVAQYPLFTTLLVVSGAVATTWLYQHDPDASPPDPA